MDELVSLCRFGSVQAGLKKRIETDSLESGQRNGCRPRGRSRQFTNCTDEAGQECEVQSARYRVQGMEGMTRTKSPLDVAQGSCSSYKRRGGNSATVSEHLYLEADNNSSPYQIGVILRSILVVSIPRVLVGKV
ncbi:hypothetical protein K438DRAFT_306130 [Mycena galopus ATCC 62051]|nr:hypothetical protein K438DRAFT_306130 [Mycena galopus ATCC 62051]